MKTKTFIHFVIFVMLISKVNAQYCTDDSRYTEVQYFDSTEITIGSNIQFGSALDFQGNPYIMEMDFYYPNLAVDTSAKRPFIMLFHGGGFQSGDKQSVDIVDLCVHLALRGFVCASVNYRLGWDGTEYGQYKAIYRAIQDGRAAMRYVINNANAVRIDTSWIFIGGQSAGSVLSQGMVYSDQSELDSVSLLYNATATSVELGNLYTSGNNLTNTYSIKGIFNNWGGVTESFVDIDEMIPTIAFHGELDPTVLIDTDSSSLYSILLGSRAMHNNLIANNICSELTVDTTGGHGIFRNASSVFRAQRASCFFKSVFCNVCNDFYTTDSIPSNCSISLGNDESNFNSITEILDIHVYPNPFKNSFKIDGITGVFEVSIYNFFGQLVYKDEKNNGNIEIDLTPGMYFLKIHQPESTLSFTSKLIKN